MKNQSPNKSESLSNGEKTAINHSKVRTFGLAKMNVNCRSKMFDKNFTQQVQTGSDTQYNQVTLTYSDEDSFKKSQEKTAK